MLASIALDRSHMLGANFEVYRVAAETALGGGNFYDVAPERFPEFYYLYPPITIVPFLPFAGVGLWSGFLIHTVMEVGLGLLLAWVIVRWIERYRNLAALDYALIAGFVVASIHTVPSLVYGQVNLRMALLVGLGLWLLERSIDADAGSPGVTSRSTTSLETGSKAGPGTRSTARLETLAGVALAGAALLKVFPAAIGVWLLGLRAWRALAGAVVTGVTGLAVGALLFGVDRTWAFFLDALLGRTDDAVFAGGLDPLASYVTVRRPLSFLVPGLEPTLLWLFAAVVLAPPLFYVYTDLETPVDRLVAAHATVLAVLVYFPSYPLYYPIVFATLVPAVYLVADPLPRRLLVAGGVLANVVVLGPTFASIVDLAPPAIGGPLETVGFAVLSVASPVLVGCLVGLAGCVCHRYRRATARRSSSPS